jgi:endonuclease YncB( thermonuclease family)
MRKKKVLLVVSCGSLVCCSFVLILALIKAVVPTSKEGGEKKLAEATGIIVSELKPTATDTIKPTISLSPIFTPVPINTPTLEPPPTASQTIIVLNIPQCIQNNPIGTEALVTNVIDGDTIEVDVNGNIYKVRYIGMDTPEITNPPEEISQEAASKNIELVFGKKVIMYKDVSETDRFDRLLRYVLVEDVFVNYELVRSGFAKAISYPPDTACDSMFAEAEKEARTNLVGLWALDIGKRSENITPQSAAVSNQVVITYIFYNGVVAQVESDEYAEITNKGDNSVQLFGWRLNAGAPSQNFIFPDFELLPGQSCRIYTNEVHPDSCGFSFHNPQAVWKNSGDCGYLYNAAGEEVSKYCY